MDYSWRLTEVAAGFQAFVLTPGRDSQASVQSVPSPGTERAEVVSPGIVTTRRGGVSEGPFGDLNVSFRVGDDPVRVRGNRELVACSLGLEDGGCARPEQIHGDLVLPADCPGDAAGADGLVSASRRLWLSVHVADCVPVFVFAPDLGWVGLAHAGRKGTAAGITANLINVFRSSCQCEVSQLTVALGPSVGPCCYELDEETASRLRADCVVRRQGKFFFDLWEANKLQALEEGIRQDSVVMPPACTSCRADLFFSHRAHAGRTGRQMAVTRPGGLRLRVPATRPE
jgi:YfiH family protein